MFKTPKRKIILSQYFILAHDANSCSHAKSLVFEDISTLLAVKITSFIFYHIGCHLQMVFARAALGTKINL